VGVQCGFHGGTQSTINGGRPCDTADSDIQCRVVGYGGGRAERDGQQDGKLLHRV
jgi:hypothetical protein